MGGQCTTGTPCCQTRDGDATKVGGGVSSGRGGGKCASEMKDLNQIVAVTDDLPFLDAVSVLNKNRQPRAVYPADKDQPDDTDEQPEYLVVLDKSGGEPLGIVVDCGDHAFMPVLRVSGGLAAWWNEENPPSVALAAGDHIVEVNRVRGRSKLMMERCRLDAVLRIMVKRNT